MDRVEPADRCITPAAPQFRRDWDADEIYTNAARVAFGVGALRLVDQAPTFAQRQRQQRA